MNMIRASLLALLLGFTASSQAAGELGNPIFQVPCAGATCPIPIGTTKYLNCVCGQQVLDIQILDPVTAGLRKDLRLGVNAFPMTLKSRLIGTGPAVLVTQDVKLQRSLRAGFVVKNIYFEQTSKMTMVIAPLANR